MMLCWVRWYCFLRYASRKFDEGRGDDAETNGSGEDGMRRVFGGVGSFPVVGAVEALEAESSSIAECCCYGPAAVCGSGSSSVCSAAATAAGSRSAT